MKYQPGWGKTRLKIVCLVGFIVFGFAMQQPVRYEPYRPPGKSEYDMTARERLDRHHAESLSSFISGLMVSPIVLVFGAAAVAFAMAHVMRKR